MVKNDCKSLTSQGVCVLHNYRICPLEFEDGSELPCQGVCYEQSECHNKEGVIGNCRTWDHFNGPKGCWMSECEFYKEGMFKDIPEYLKGRKR